MGYYIVDVEFTFNENTKVFSLKRMSEDDLRKAKVSNIRDVWSAVNCARCEGEFALAKHVGITSWSIGYQELILDMAKKCYLAMSTKERTLMHEAVKEGIIYNNRRLVWSIEEATIGFLMCAICKYIGHTKPYVKEVTHLYGALAQLDDHIYNGYSQRNPTMRYPF